MAYSRGNIRILNMQTIIIFLIVCLGFLSLNNNKEGKLYSKKAIPVYITVSSRDAISTQEFKVQILQRSWIANKDNFKLLSFIQNPFRANRITDIKKSCLDNKRLAFIIKPQSFLLYHLFPSETDYPHS